ncbi:MAG: ABC transporter permease [Methylobacteriaceae bacterium]|nr:ABC transporter permease [Methylobacteriaceae bacterium]MBV9703318.1 ABC transporter permease [Methylobacteriaceae bacterium]
MSQQVSDAASYGAPRFTLAQRVRIGRYRPLIIACVVFVACLAIIASIGSAPLSYYDLASMATSGATLAITAVGQTLVILSGGFDLSAGAVVSLVNVTLATILPDPATSPFLLAAAGIGIGLLSGAFNGFFVAVLRLQPIVVTLSSMFILQGVTLLVMDKPGGLVASSLGEALIGDAVPNLLPKPVVLLAALAILWLWLKRTRLGVAIYAIGSNFDSAQAAGVPTTLTQFLVYVLAGGCYGLGGVYISAQTGSGDPLVGNPMLVQVFAAVVVGGTRLGGGRGGAFGSIIGAYILMMVVNILLVLNVSAYYSSVAEGTILILAVLGASISRNSVLAHHLRLALTRWRAYRAGLLPSQRHGPEQRLALPPRTGTAAARAPSAMPSFLARHAETLRFTAPAYVCFALVVVATQLVLGNALFSWKYYDSLIVLSSFLAILALGQGSVILTGGLDLSLPWTIGLCGILLAGMLKGSDAALLYALPLVLLIGLLIGFVNGVGIVVLGISPIVMTLAVNGILQGLALVYCNGTPAGFSAPILRWFMTSQEWPVTPVVLFILVFVAAAVLLLDKTPFGRRIYAVGNGERAAVLSGVAVGPTLIKVYMLSGLSSAIVGSLLTGFSGQASLGMGDEYLLPSIAVVVVGGTLITGGRGHYLGMLGGVLLLTALQTLLSGTTLPYAIRAILFGLVVLGAVMALRERRA